MPEAVVAWVGEAVLEYLGEAAFAAFVDAAIVAPYVLAAASVYTLREQQRQAQNRAKDAYNANLRDRYVMQRSATQQRSMVLGRARVSGPMGFTRSFGASNANLVMIVALAAHECDAIEKVYFDDDQLVLDGSGNVISTLKSEKFSINSASATYTLAVAASAGVTAVATYDTGDVACGVSLSGDGLTVTVTGASATKIGSLVISYQPLVNVFSQSVTRTTSASATVTADGSGNGSYTAPAGLFIASASAVQVGGNSDVPLFPVVTGTTITFGGVPPGASVVVTYQYAAAGSSRARVRKYLGASGQTADARLISLLPTYWTSAHRGDGICYVIVELDYDPDSFPGGLPNVSAVVRGLKCYDPRTSTTAWTDNPALLMRGFWLHPLGAGRSSVEIDDTAVIAAANTCDTSATYTVGSNKFTRPLYRASTVASKDRRPQDVLNDLAQAMGGRWVVLNNTLRMRAGAYAAPVAAMNEAWLHDGTAVQVQARRNRADLINATVGTFADETHDWQTLSYPKVAPAAYATADSRELATDIHYPAVTFSGQCQFLSGAMIRYARAGLTVRMSCNMRAYPLEVFDVVTLTLARFGWSAKTFEVIESSFSLEGLIELTLKEIDASIWTLDAAFLATDYALKTNLPSPWVAEVPVLGTPVSGTAQLQKLGDGTILSRIYVTWTAITSPNVLNGGSIEVQWLRVDDPAGVWQTLTLPGDASAAYISNVVDGRAYLIRARTLTRLAASGWSAQKTHLVQGKSAAPAAVQGFALKVVPGSLLGSRTPSTELDFDHTAYRYGASFASGVAVPGTADGAGFVWPGPPTGSVTVWAADVDSSGNVGAAVSQTITINAADLAPGIAALSIKRNVGDFAGTTNYNECWIHGLTPAGVAVDAPGRIMINGTAVDVPNGLLYGSQGPFAGFIVLDRGGTTFTISGGSAGYAYVAARRYGGQWQYDNNAAWVNFTPIAAHNIIGTVESGAGDAGAPGSPPGIVAASMWVYGTTLDAMTANQALPSVTVRSDNFDSNAAGYGGHGVSFSTGFTTSLGPTGHVLTVYDPATDAIVSSPTLYSTYPSGTAALVTALAGVAAGYLVLLYQTDASTHDAALRTALMDFGGSGTSALWTNARVSHAFIGQRGLAPGQAFEAIDTYHPAAPFGLVSLQAYYSTSGLISNGAAGSTGLTNALVYIYQRSASGAPALPSATATYTFATAVLTGLNNGWSATPPAGTDPLYMSVATASSSAGSDTIAGGEWASAVLLAASGADGANGTNGSNGSNGANGVNAATVYLFQRTASPSAPALPSATVTYTFATSTATGLTNGWTQSLPTTGGAYRWVTTASALSTSGTDNIASSEWAAAALLAQDGTDGSDGTDGTNGTNGQDAIAMTISTASVNLQADSAGVVSDYSLATTTAKVMKGTSDDTANWTFSRTNGSGVTSSLSGAALTVSAMTGDTGYVDITATRSGYSSQTLRFTLAKVRAPAASSGVLNGVFFQADTPDSGSGTQVASIRFKSDGTVQADQAGGGYATVGSWYAPTTGGIGSSYWLKVSKRTPTNFSSNSGMDVWLALSSDKTYTNSVASGGGPRDTVADYYIATHSDGTGIVGTGTFECSAGT